MYKYSFDWDNLTRFIINFLQSNFSLFMELDQLFFYFLFYQIVFIYQILFLQIFNNQPLKLVCRFFKYFK